MPEPGVAGWVVVCICSVLVGAAKTGLPGLVILAVPLMAAVMPAKSSVGLLLGILVIGDIFAASYYRRSARWWHLVRLLPCALVGVIIGYAVLAAVSDEQLEPIIGVVVLVMLVVNYLRTENAEQAVPKSLWFVVSMGVLAGAATMLANAAGPIMIIYLVAMRLNKFEFIGTAAWFFFIINWVKVPFGVNLGIITLETAKLNLMMLPFVAAGAFFGIYLLKRISLGFFRVAVQILAAAAAIRLLFF